MPHFGIPLKTSQKVKIPIFILKKCDFITLALTFSNDAGFTNEKQIRKTSCNKISPSVQNKKQTRLISDKWLSRGNLQSVGRKVVVACRNLLDLLYPTTQD